MDYEYEVQGYYCGSWEMLTTEASRQEALDMMACYDENEPHVPHRIRRRRCDHV